MTPRVLLAGCAALPRGDGDEDVLLAALAEQGCDADWIVWDDTSNDAARADLVVLRATWDYSARRAEFLRWCESLPALRNAAAVARWNTDKSYLLDLELAGLPVVPTELVPPGAAPRWPDTEFVVKPSVGAGSRGARRFTPAAVDAASGHLNELHAGGFTGLIQPYQSHVDTHGETALVFIGGNYSHAFVKGPMLTHQSTIISGLFAAERVQPVTPAADLLRFAEEAMDGAAATLHIDRGELLYARVDVVRGGDGTPMVLEFEVTEPSLGLRFSAQAPDRLASAIRRLIAAY